MGRWDEHKRVAAGAPAVIDARGRAALTVRDLQLIDLRDAWLDAEEQAGAALRAWYSVRAARREGRLRRVCRRAGSRGGRGIPARVPPRDPRPRAGLAMDLLL